MNGEEYLFLGSATFCYCYCCFVVIPSSEEGACLPNLTMLTWWQLLVLRSKGSNDWPAADPPCGLGVLVSEPQARAGGVGRFTATLCGWKFSVLVHAF